MKYMVVVTTVIEHPVIVEAPNPEEAKKIGLAIVNKEWYPNDLVIKRVIFMKDVTLMKG